MKKILSLLQDQNKNFKIFAIIFSIYCALILGISWDENYYKILGEKNLSYLLSFGIIESEYFSKFRYSTIYWSFSSLIGQIIPEKFSDQFYHLLNTFFGLLVIVGVYKIAKLLFNKSIGIICSFFLFFLPTFFGHLAINNKDTILALSHVWIFYYLIKYNSQNYSNLTKLKIISKIAFFSALGTGIQLLFLGSTLPLVIYFLYNYFFIKKRKLKALIIDFLIFITIFYLILVLFWVDAHPNIFTLPFKFFLTTLTLDIGWPFNVSNGNYFFSKEAPFYYIFENLLFKLPEFIIYLYLVFTFILLFNYKKLKKKYFNLNKHLILFISILLYPSIIILFIPYPIYDGLRLFLWFIPYIVFIPAIVLDFVYNNLKYRKFKLISILFALLFLYHLFNFFSITPYQYTYLNSLNGKKINRYQKFEGDYWSVSLKELIFESKLNSDKQIRYATCGLNSEIAKIYMKKKYKNTLNTNIENAQYLILTNRTLYSQKMGKISNCFDEFNFKNIFYVKRNGVILSAIKKIDK